MCLNHYIANWLKVRYCICNVCGYFLVRLLHKFYEEIGIAYNAYVCRSHTAAKTSLSATGQVLYHIHNAFSNSFFASGLYVWNNSPTDA